MKSILDCIRNRKKLPVCWHCSPKRVRPWQFKWFNEDRGTTCWQHSCGFLTVKKTAKGRA